MSDVWHGYATGEKKNIQTLHRWPTVQHDNAIGRNKRNKTDNERSVFQHGHDAGAYKPVAQFTVIEQERNLPGFSLSKTPCISADFRLGAGLVKQTKQKFPCLFSTKKSKSNKYCTQSTWVILVLFQSMVKQRYSQKPTYLSLRKPSLVFQDHMSFYRIYKLGFLHL